MSQNQITITSAVVDTRQLLLYKEDGEVIRIPQGDPRIARILEEVTPALLQKGVAQISLDGPNIYLDYEKQSNGLVKLFRVAKTAVSRFFGGEKPPTSIPQLGLTPPPGQEIRVKQAISEVLEHAVPASSGHFQNVAVTPDSDQTIVAVVEDKLIPGVESLQPQIKRSVDSGSSKGMDAFMQRLSRVIELRQHSVEDLLKFMERGDLPVADDGSIVIYKVLRRDGTKKDTYVDCHTQRVPQKIGSYVVMDETLVDPDRRNECSNGLHVARRAYVGNFSGDVCVIAKVAPEDVIAVPEHDPNKMRVCGYHILYELSPEDFAKIQRNEPFTDNDKSKKALAKILEGIHVGKLEEVRIHGQNGTQVVVTPLQSEATPAKPTEPIKVDKGTALSDATATAPAVDPKQVSKAVQKTKETLGRKAKAQKLYAMWLEASGDTAKYLAEELKAHKKASKVSWETLGIPKEFAQTKDII